MLTKTASPAFPDRIYSGRRQRIRPVRRFWANVLNFVLKATVPRRILLTLISLSAFLMASSPAHSQSALQAQMTKIAAATHGPIGAAVIVVEGGKIVALHGEQQFPMQSVYKLPIGMAILHQVDLGKLSLTQKVRITKAELPLPLHYSAIRVDYPSGGTLTVSKLLEEMICFSDGTACDILLKFAGGPQRVTAYLRGLGVQNMIVATSEKTMWQNEQVQQYRNWATPEAMVDLLCKLQQGRGLTQPSRHLLLSLMTSSKTGPNRIKGLLPPGTAVAHKTGSSETVNGLTRATNDAGLVTLPNGRHLAIVVFVSDTRVNEAVQEAVIAKIARAAWDGRAGLEGRKRVTR